MKNQDATPFPDELKHLNKTLKIIDTALEEAREDVFRLDQEYRDAKKYMADYRNEMDNHEKLQNGPALYCLYKSYAYTDTFLYRKSVPLPAKTGCYLVFVRINKEMCLS